jgi:hypothetical protein
MSEMGDQPSERSREVKHTTESSPSNSTRKRVDPIQLTDISATRRVTTKPSPDHEYGAEKSLSNMTVRPHVLSQAYPR